MPKVKVEDRRLAAIMFADISGYSRMMSLNEDLTLSMNDYFIKTSSNIVSSYEGKIIKKIGDAVFCEFNSSKNAVDASMEIQKSLSEYNHSQPKDFKLLIRIGIHIGDIVVEEDGDILGDGVNVASRIESLASPGGICLTEAVYESIKSKINISPRRISNVDLKHIDDKYTIYKLPNDDDVLDEKESDGHLSKIKIINAKYDNDFFASILTQYKYNLPFIAICFIIYHSVYSLAASLSIIDFSRYFDPYYALPSHIEQLQLKMKTLINIHHLFF